MSTALEAASLIMVPSGYSDGMLGSVKPTDSSGNFTFTRGTDIGATRVAEDGYIEKGYENLLLQSNNFNTGWVKVSSTVTSGQSGYDGSSGAWLLEKVGAYGRLDQSKSFLGVQTFSLYVKLVDPAQANGVSLRVDIPGNIAITNFNLETQVITESNSFSSIIEQVGNDGWYRCSTTYVGSGTVARIYVALNGQTSLATGSLLIQDTQIEQGLVAMPYLPTTTTTSVGGILADQPRIDYTGGGCGSLLLEPSRTNELLYSEYFDGWQKLVVPTVTTNYGISPEGVQNSTRFQTSVGRLTQDIITINNNETFSVYMKGSGTLRIEIGSDNFFPSVTSEWVRYEFKTTQIGGNSSVQIRGNGSPVDVELYGAQYERNSYATSLIPTYGTSVTRAQDVCYKTGISSLIGQTEGVLYWEGENIGENFAPYLGLFADAPNANSTRVMVYYLSQTTIQVQVRLSGVVQFLSAAATVSGKTKVAIGYRENDFVLYVNGVKISESSSGSTFTNQLTTFNFNSAICKSEQILLFKTRLSNAELTELTTI